MAGLPVFRADGHECSTASESVVPLDVVSTLLRGVHGVSFRLRVIFRLKNALNIDGGCFQCTDFNALCKVIRPDAAIGYTIRQNIFFHLAVTKGPEATNNQRRGMARERSSPS